MAEKRPGNESRSEAARKRRKVATKTPGRRHRGGVEKNHYRDCDSQGQLRARLVEDIIQRLLERFSNEVEKASITDLIRLMQINEGMEDTRPKEIIVTWVEPTIESE